MQVVARALVVVDGHAHEGRDDTVHVSHLLDQRFEQERAVGGLDRRAVRQVDLVLRVSVLLRHRDRLEAELLAGLEHAADETRRIRQRSHRVDARIAHRQRTHAADTLGVTLQEVELQLVRDHRGVAQRGVALGDALERAAGIQATGLVRRDGLQIAQHHGDLRIKRMNARGLQIGDRNEIAEPRLLAADNVVPVVDRHDGLDEGLAMRNGVGGSGQQNILAALNAVEVAIGEPQDTDALGLQLLDGHASPSQSMRRLYPDRQGSICWSASNHGGHHARSALSECSRRDPPRSS